MLQPRDCVANVMHNFPGVILDTQKRGTSYPLILTAVLLEAPDGINARRAFLNEDKESPVSIVLVYVETSFNTF
jgi:hypothetical protein